MKFSELQKILNDKYGIDHLADIARELEVTPQAVSNWKARDRVPYKYVLRLRQDSNSDLSIKNIQNQLDTKESTINQIEAYVEEDTVTFFDILLVLARQLKILLFIPTIFCVITIIYALFIAQPIYESTAKIMSSSRTGGPISQAAGLAAQFGFNLPTNQSEPEWVYPEIIKSRTLARVC